MNGTDLLVDPTRTDGSKECASQGLPTLVSAGDNAFSDLKKMTIPNQSQRFNGHKENIDNLHPPSFPSSFNNRSHHLHNSYSSSKYSSAPSSSDVFKFIHEDDRFKELIKLCAEERGVDPSLVEKDYYISHALWCLRKKGLEIQIKGGVSLAKGFGVINRLSEDVDIVVHPKKSCSSFLHQIVKQLDEIDMKSKLKTRERAKLWIKFANVVKGSLSGMDVHIGTKSSPFYDPRWVHLVLHATYVNMFPIIDGDLMPAEIVLEFCTGVDEPLEPIPTRITSFIHTFLDRKHLLNQFKRNLPTVLCTHPMITLMQKISDGLVNRYQRPMALDGPMPPFVSGLRGREPPFDPRIIRHYEDSAMIITNIAHCFPLSKPAEYQQLFTDLMQRRMVRRHIESGTTIHGDESLLLLDKDRTKVEALQLCQQQRICLYYDRKVDSHSSLNPSPPLLTSCAAIIREWLLSVGL